MNERETELVSKIKGLDPNVASEVAQYFSTIKKQKKFGLVFEQKERENHVMPEMTPFVGAYARFVSTSEKAGGGLLKVEEVDGDNIILHNTENDSFVRCEASEIEVVLTPGCKFLPGLKINDTVGKFEPGKPSHLLINSDNYYALELLKRTHAEKVDLIYIDPPYNTGNKDWKYNDAYVDNNDVYRHSKWLSFMETRLQLAHSLLKESGVIIVAIGDDEHHRLRMLLDEIFGERNFISNIIWEGGKKNNAKFISSSVDYMLIYSKNKTLLSSNKIRWREPKESVNEIMEAGRKAWEKSGFDNKLANKIFKEWWKNLPDNHPALKSKLYDRICGSTGKVYSSGDMSPPGGKGSRYDLIHPKTGLPVVTPSRGWAYNWKTMQKMLAEDRIQFGEDHTKGVRYKRYLEETSLQVPSSVFYKDRQAATVSLNKIFNDKRFEYPKDSEILERWINIVAPKDALILDFFGGSGTTGEAVQKLNDKDGGARQCILVTNNEVSNEKSIQLKKGGITINSSEYEKYGIAHYITWERLKIVTTGIRDDGSKYSDGLSGSWVFADLQFINPDLISSNKNFDLLNPVLWLSSGAVNDVVDANPSNTPYFLGDNYGVLFDVDYLNEFLMNVSKENKEHFLNLYVNAPDNKQFQYISQQLNYVSDAEVNKLYQNYLHQFGY